MVHLIILFYFVSQLECLSLRSPLFEEDAVLEVIERMPKWVGDEFSEIRIDPSKYIEEGKVTISINNTGHKRIDANSAVDALYGLHYFLRVHCASSVSWNSVSFSNGCDKVEPRRITLKAPKVRYFGNPCTYSYSFAWWNWNEWEKFIDWLALSGFNMVLAPVGQEYLWKKLWMEIGIPEKALDNFFAGPPFQAWHRMGNIKGWGGPMSDSFQLQQFELNQKIVTRLGRLGIVPVLPTFSGFVPEEIEQVFPGVKVRRNGNWNNFNETFSYVTSLHPQEAIFKKIAKMFVRMQQKVYGHVTHVYSADPFNEIPPIEKRGRNKVQSTNPLIPLTAQAIYEGCREADPNCIWLVQGWMFAYDNWSLQDAKAFLKAIPKGKLLILDLYAEEEPVYIRYNNFWGHEFIWCLLHNFGGTTQMRGNMKHVNKAWLHAVQSSPSLIGGGLSMEAIGHNYVLYQFMIDSWWNQERISIPIWLTSFVSSRYSAKSVVSVKSWFTIAETFYSQPYTGLGNEMKVFIYYRPRFGGRIKYWFDTKRLSLLVEAFTSLNSTLGENQNFRNDLRDILREDLQHDIGNRLILRVYEGYGMNDTSTMNTACRALDMAFQLLDETTNYNVYDYIQSARRWGSTKEESDQFERNARYILTLWGPEGNVLDYSHREWAGLVNNYYRPRWNYFCETLITSPGIFNKKKFDREVFEYIEEPFTHVDHSEL